MKPKDPKDLVLKVKITSPKEIIFQDDAFSVSSKNSKGVFDILPLHANFITIIENEPIVVRKANKEVQSFIFPVAIMYTRDNQVDIYTDIQIYEER